MAIKHVKNLLSARFEDGNLIVKVVGVGTYGKTDKSVASEILLELSEDTKAVLTELFDSILEAYEEEMTERILEEAGSAQALARRLGEE